LSGAAVALVAVKPDLPDGLLPVTVLLCVFMLANYSLVLCSAVHVHSEGPMTIVIVLHNIAITLFLFLIVAIGDIQRHMQGPVAVWNSAFWSVLAVELLVFAALAGTPYLVAARRRDFV
jgi:ABC-2 type transport system permease protein